MQECKLYVGNLSYSLTQDELRDAFASHGELKEVILIEGKGFGFVEFNNEDDAERAREALNGQDLKGRPMRIDKARPPKR
ncbi:MAG: RNA-binding protein [Elusimicrobiota bacterium]